MQILADQAMHKLCGVEYSNCKTVLDIGCGPGIHSDWFISQGKSVTSCDIKQSYPNAIVCDYMTTQFNKHDIVWCSHVLEHQRDTDKFINKMLSETSDNGFLAITVPPLKHEIVGGHVTLWNAGLLLYRLILCGIDCSRAKVHCYDYNISVIVQKNIIPNMPQLKHDEGDIEQLAHYFPVQARQGFDGRIGSVNW